MTEKKLKLYEFTALLNEEGSKIERVVGKIADHSDPAQQKEYITFQIVIDEQFSRRDAYLRSKALKKVHEICFQLSRDYERILLEIEPGT